MKAAGDCSVKVQGRVLNWYPCMNEAGMNEVGMNGYYMDHETPIDPKEISPSQRKRVMESMIHVVPKLHSKGIIHGDIKLANMLLCSDGEVRLCDFGEARYINETDEYEGKETTNYLSPRRCESWREAGVIPPEVEDDLYALGLSIWELYTGKTPFDGECEDDIMDALAEGKTVNIDEVEDASVRPIIREYFRKGCAKL